MKTTAPLPLDPASARQLRRASLTAALASALWPVQAGCLAMMIHAWVTGGNASAALLAAVFALTGLARAGLERWASGQAFAAADQTVHALRQTLLDREPRLLRADVSSAEIAALYGQKLPLLVPYLTRYKPAMMRVRVVPLLLIALVAWHNWAAALALLIAVPTIPLFMALVGMAAKDASAKQLVEIGDMNRLLVDHLAVMPDARLLGGLDRSRAVFAASAEALRDRTMAVLRVAFLSSTVLELFSAIGVALVAILVGFTLLGEVTIGTWGGSLSVYQGVFILLLAPDVFLPLRDLASAWHDKASAEAVLDELADLEARDTAAILGTGARVAALPGAGSVTIQDAATERGPLPDLVVPAGGSLALVGPSGAGKSTTIEAIAGLIPHSGHLRVAGAPLTDATADAWRARLALVPQRVHLPDMPLDRYLDPHGRGGVAEALRLAHAAHIVAALPDGLGTVLGETGAGVSGGEMRRLLLARAFLSGADVILADEPTADLDARTAAQITQALIAAKARGATVIVATHDATLAEAMDQTLEVKA
ncbi:ABC transporter ATP-binding protein/permease [Tropicibacter naphthalenivorans]|uniref:ATP-binding/permease protein CydD n=1 Tax=Tropicibacter naphthalenivorans TaxID=441103 RepID=A0A0P1G0P2_9RHOB|nr:ATP-binding cassette domain-containing protein [Tropicibacter naphthalenivorans]CUH75299.1 ATP-binding/permease protein CydD [Tropicibacter naphthalenivorans]SMC45172.1 ATP-binding cassette, subfamily C, CydD [Tropicibacter naphthalenivorans]